MERPDNIFGMHLYKFGIMEWHKSSSQKIATFLAANEWSVLNSDRLSNPHVTYTCKQTQVVVLSVQNRSCAYVMNSVCLYNELHYHNEYLHVTNMPTVRTRGGTQTCIFIWHVPGRVLFRRSVGWLVKFFLKNRTILALRLLQHHTLRQTCETAHCSDVFTPLSLQRPIDK